MESLAQAQEGLDSWNKRFNEIKQAMIGGLSPDEARVLELTLLSRQARALKKRIQPEIAAEVEIKLQAMKDLSFALQEGNFIAALELAEKLR